jgi:hypothetical protein
MPSGNPIPVVSEAVAAAPVNSGVGEDALNEIALAKVALRKMGTAERDIPAALQRMQFSQQVGKALQAKSDVLENVGNPSRLSEEYIAKRNKLQGIQVGRSASPRATTSEVTPDMTMEQYNTLTSDPDNLEMLLTATRDFQEAHGRLPGIAPREASATTAALRKTLGISGAAWAALTAQQKRDRLAGLALRP